MDLVEVAGVLWSLSFDKQNVKEFVELHKDKIKEKSLSEASLRDIRLFLGGIARVNPNLAREIKKNLGNIRKSGSP